MAAVPAAARDNLVALLVTAAPNGITPEEGARLAKAVGQSVAAVTQIIIEMLGILDEQRAALGTPEDEALAPKLWDTCEKGEFFALVSEVYVPRGIVWRAFCEKGSALAASGIMGDVKEALEEGAEPSTVGIPPPSRVRLTKAARA